LPAARWMPSTIRSGRRDLNPRPPAPKAGWSPSGSCHLMAVGAVYQVRREMGETRRTSQHGPVHGELIHLWYIARPSRPSAVPHRGGSRSMIGTASTQSPHRFATRCRAGGFGRGGSGLPPVVRGRPARSVLCVVPRWNCPTAMLSASPATARNASAQPSGWADPTSVAESTVALPIGHSGTQGGLAM
jgi:hypothetical protein